MASDYISKKIEEKKSEQEAEKARRQSESEKEIGRLYDQSYAGDELRQSRAMLASRIIELTQIENMRDSKLMEMSCIELKKEEVQDGSHLEKVEKNLRAYENAVKLIDRDIEKRKADLDAYREAMNLYMMKQKMGFEPPAEELSKLKISNPKKRLLNESLLEIMQIIHDEGPSRSMMKIYEPLNSYVTGHRNEAGLKDVADAVDGYLESHTDPLWKTKKSTEKLRTVRELKNRLIKISGENK